MPKIVDHDKQRATFVRAAIRLIARDGFEGMNMRAVASEAGLSYGSLFHYFDSKEELLMQSVRYLTSQQSRRVNDYSSKYRGLKALQHLLIDDALVKGEGRDDAIVWLAFLYKAVLHQRFADMYSELIDGWLHRIRQLLDDAQQAGEIQPDLDTGFEASAIWVYSVGIGQQGLLQPELFPPKTQKKLIAAYLNRLR